MSTPRTPQIWNGHCNFVPGIMTPFGFYDDDPQFQEAACKVARFCATRLGYPMMDVELESGSFFAAFEEAITTYGNKVYEWKVRENYLSMEGGRTDIEANTMVVEPTLQRIVEIAKNYGTEAVVGGNITLHHGMLRLDPGVQQYDLNKWAEAQGVVGGIEIRKIFYEAPPAILRYFDPYAGTGTGLQSLMDAFGFGAYSPGVNFLLMPISADLLKLQAIEFNDQIRKSTYSFECHNNILTIFPIPSQGGFLRIDYYRLADKRKLNTNVKLVNTMSTHKMRFSVNTLPGNSVTKTFQHNLGTKEVSVQVFEEDEDGSVKMMIPEEVKIVSCDSVEVTFSASAKGYLIIGYPENGIVVPSEGGDPGIIRHVVDFSAQIPEKGNMCRRVINHNLGTEDLQVTVFVDVETENGMESTMIYPADVVVVDPNTIYVDFVENVPYGHIILQATYENLDDVNKTITNVSEVPYANPVYSKINSIGKQWILRYTLALCKEILAYVRGKYSTLPIPDSEATLNQADLLTDARAEKEDLMKQLDDMLNGTSRQAQLERKAQEAEYLEKTLKGVPMLIYIG